MTPSEFTAARERLGYTIRGLAVALHIGSKNAVRLWGRKGYNNELLRLALAYLQHLADTGKLEGSAYDVAICNAAGQEINRQEREGARKNKRKGAKT